MTERASGARCSLLSEPAAANCRCRCTCRCLLTWRRTLRAAMFTRAMRRAWAQLIKRTYEVDPLVCPSCGSEMKVIADVTEQPVLDKILDHLRRKADEKSRGSPAPLSAVS